MFFFPAGQSPLQFGSISVVERAKPSTKWAFFGSASSWSVHSPLQIGPFLVVFKALYKLGLFRKCMPYLVRGGDQTYLFQKSETLYVGARVRSKWITSNWAHRVCTCDQTSAVPILRYVCIRRVVVVLMTCFRSTRTRRNHPNFCARAPWKRIP